MPYLLWNHHISIITAEALHTLGYIKSIPTTLFTQISLQNVGPKTEYVSVTQTAHQLYLINLIQAIQNCAAHFVTSSNSFDISVTVLKNSLGLAHLTTPCVIACFFLPQRLYSPLCAFHISSATSRLRSGSIKCVLGKKYSYSSFLPIRISAWNSIAENTVVISDLHTFWEHLTELNS